MYPNFTQIQGSCDSLNQWEFSDIFQAVFNEVRAWLEVTMTTPNLAMIFIQTTDNGYHSAFDYRKLHLPLF